MLHRILSIAFLITGGVLAVIFYSEMTIPDNISGYFKREYYGQLGGIVIAIELITAGMHLLQKHKKINFTMALFGFSAVLDPIFNYTGILSSNVPDYGTIIFLVFAVVALYIAFTNAFDSDKISIRNILLSLILGVIIELFFNYF